MTVLRLTSRQEKRVRACAAVVPGSIRFRADVLARALDLHMCIRGLSVREAAAEIGVSHSTVNRVARGYKPDIDSYFRIRFWLETQRQRYPLSPYR
jgi:hypothetical protein